jgi:hypothetical protein
MPSQIAPHLAGKEENPILPRLKRIKKRRDPIVLPRLKDVANVIARADINGRPGGSDLGEPSRCPRHGKSRRMLNVPASASRRNSVDRTVIR